MVKNPTPPTNCRLNDDDYIWIKAKREKEELCTLRRRKIIDAVLVWAAVGIASGMVAGLTGAAKVIWDFL